MKKYVKSPQADVVILPGIGKLTEGQEVTGDYDKFVPQFLVEVPSASGQKTLESTPTRNPRHLTEPAPIKTAPESEHAQAKGGGGATVSENASSHSSKDALKDEKTEDDKAKHKKSSSKGNE